MALEIFKLVGSIFVNSDAAEESLEKTDSKAQNVGKSLLNGVGTAAKWGAGIVTATSAAAAGMVAMAQSSAGAADKIDKMSQKIGVSRQAYQELDFICSQSGTDVDKLQAGVKSLTAAMSGAAKGTASNVEQFRKLGVEVTNADGSMRAQEDVLFDTLSALQGMENQTEKARLATELFGKSGTELMPLLNGASGSIDEMKQQAHDLGLVLSDELIDNGVNLTDSLDQTKRAFKSIVVQIGGSFMPVVEKASDFIQTMLPSIQQLIAQIGPVATEMLETVLPPLMGLVISVLPVLLSLLESILPSLADIVQLILPIIVELLEKLIPVAVTILDSVLPITIELLGKIMPILSDLVQSLLPLIVKIIEKLVPTLAPILSVLAPILELVDMLIDPLVQILDAVITPLVDMLVMLILPLTEILNEIIPPLISIITLLIEPITTILTELLQPIMAILGELIAPLTDMLSGILPPLVEILLLIIEPLTQLLNLILPPLLDVIELLISVGLIPFRSAFEILAKTLTTVVANAFANIKTYVEMLKTVFQNIIDFVKNVFTGNWNGAWQNIKNIFSSVFSSLKSIIGNTLNSMLGIVKTPINGVLTMVNKMVDALNGIKIDIPSWIPAIGGKKFGFDLKKVAYLAEGGVVDKATPAVIGEDGPEAVVPLKNNTDWINNVAAKIQNEISSTDDGKTIEELKKIENKLDRLIGLLERLIPLLLTMGDKKIILDTGILVGEIAEEMDYELGRIVTRRDRGG